MSARTQTRPMIAILALGAAMILFGATVFIGATPTQAQDLSSAVTRRAVRAAVKITARSPDGHVSTGSGSIIDARGYVLTNFHVVGFNNPGQGLPGTFINPANEVTISMVDSARDTAEERYIGTVVRANVRLDMALVRIVRRSDGGALRRSYRFPTVQLGTTRSLRPGTQLYAFGFPLGVHTINVTAGQMSGFQMNSRNEVAWIRTDAEFNPGNSGGMLVDRRGRLIAVPTAVWSGRGTLEPIELARPVERMPQEWRRAMRRGIEDTIIEGVPELVLDQEYEEQAVGDGGAFDRPEMHYFRLPETRPLSVEVHPGLAVALMSERGRVTVEGRGEIAIPQGAPTNSVLAILIPPRAESGGGTLAVRIRVRRGHSGPPGWEGMPNPGQPSHRAQPAQRPSRWGQPRRH